MIPEWIEKLPAKIRAAKTLVLQRGESNWLHRMSKADAEALAITLERGLFDVKNSQASEGPLEPREAGLTVRK